MISKTHTFVEPVTLWLFSMLFSCPLTEAREQETLTPVEAAKTVYYSAVSPEFPNGLHTRLLNYFAAKLNIELSISAMPYARRIKELGKGSIDIMVGIADVGKLPDNCVLLHPAYETMTTSLFTSKGNPRHLKSMNSMEGIIVAITRRGTIRQLYKSFKQAKVVEVESLRQKIELLALGRIDTFVHFKDSAQVYLKNHDLEDKIELVPNSDTKGFNVHLAINTQSSLWSRKRELQDIIVRGRENGDFSAIRATHYAQP